MGNYWNRMQESTAFLKKWNQGFASPQIGVVLGSGLANTFPTLNRQRSIAFAEIPGFKDSTVPGHASELLIGDITSGNKTATVAVLRGRTHLYEGNHPGDVVHAVRTLAHWGTKGIILTNASGCLRTDWEVGKLMLIADHINMTNMSPLFGDAGDGFGNRFVDLSATWDAGWRALAQKTAHENNITLYEGTYYGSQGPHYETPAEVRMIQKLGGDAVGMSTVLEAIAIKHMGAKVLGLSCLTNYGSGLKGSILEHSHVVEIGKKNAKTTADLLLKLLPHLE